MKTLRTLLCLLIAALLPVSALAEELVLFCHSWRSDEEIASFQEAFPDVTVRTNLDDGQGVDFNQVLLDFVSRNYVWDLFKLPFSTGEARRLGDRGYLADLNQNAIIRETMKQLPAGIRQSVTNAKGEVFALPCELSTQHPLMAFNMEVAGALGIEKPRTYAELFQLLEDWEYDYADQADKEGYSLTDVARYELSPRRFLARMMDDYISIYADGRLISYATPEFTALMRTFDRYRDTLGEISEAVPENQTIRRKNALILTDYPLLLDYDMAMEYEGIFEPMFLSITDDPDDAVIAVDMKALSVSAGTPRLDLAIAYAEHLSSSLDDANRILLQGGSDDTPVEWEYYATTRQDYLDWIAEAEEALGDAEEEDASQLTELIGSWREELESIEARRYTYTSESIRRYAALAPRLRPMPSVSYQYYCDQQNTNYLISAFALGNIPVDQFIREFDHVQSMMNLEDQ